MQAEDPNNQGNPYAAPASDVDKEARSSVEWCDFTRRCARKIHYRLLVAGFATWGIYRFLNKLIIAFDEEWFDDVTFEILVLVAWVAFGSIIMLGVSRILNFIDCKTSTVAKFVSSFSWGNWFFNQPLVAAAIVSIGVCVCDLLMEGADSLLIGEGMWLPIRYQNALMSMSITALIVHPIFRAMCRSHYELLKQMSSRL